MDRFLAAFLLALVVLVAEADFLLRVRAALDATPALVLRLFFVESPPTTTPFHASID